ncbi:hypothetical protein MLD38_028943 [Melastoma candidum]|uniref:Uncharacterized protein n=1 Tax=Melastoma candidum TaxID=119954 RepID=A0ACB9N337_9MYRT|nr:hypothetical protein MLD38_028943 [Melastoma candidum]
MARRFWGTRKEIVLLGLIVVVELVGTGNASSLVVPSHSQGRRYNVDAAGESLGPRTDVRSPELSRTSSQKEGRDSSISIAPSAVGSSFDGIRKRWRHMFRHYHPSSLGEHPDGHRVRTPSGRPALHTAAFPPSVSPDQAPSVAFGYGPSQTPTSSQAIPPAESTMGKNKRAMPPPSMLMFPPPPPNDDCATVTCTEPLTYTPAGVPCGCVWPIQVKLHLAMALYTFFPLVSELAKEVAAGLSMDRGQVRIIGADSDSRWLTRTTVMIDLVPKGIRFTKATALSVYERFRNNEIRLNSSMFGTYEVSSVRYAGLPNSPHLPNSSGTMSADDSSFGYGNNAQAVKPLGVDVPRRKSNEHGRTVIAIIVLSLFSSLVICTIITLSLLLLCGSAPPQQDHFPSPLIRERPVGTARFGMWRSGCYTDSSSFRDTGAAYAGSARIFTVFDVERFTNKFEASRVLGEGGFGIVYSGVLDDGQEVAVKVLKRDDRHGSREFLSEVEMLGRLHHRNLVRLIGICTEDHIRCLVYELIPNGSVESHLHGHHKETDPLDWGARMKVALGAARGLAYLHEDSNPRVIHRDFKSSNILLEYDFTPKVSDFGLARAAIDDDVYRQVSTRVMGTFGYLAPEYAMTGHLLVKSDVYSYGVVLLELLTGRKPVDLSLPTGQENLVTWARPLLMDKESLECIIDRSMKSDAPIDCLAKVAAIASMCVQPEASHRPFMGEVVQALKLVCCEFDEMKDGPTSLMIDPISHEAAEASLIGEITPAHDENMSMRLSTMSDQYEESLQTEDMESRTSTRNCRSGPVRIGKGRRSWQRLQNLSRGSASEYDASLKSWPQTD